MRTNNGGLISSSSSCCWLLPVLPTPLESGICIQRDNNKKHDYSICLSPRIHNFPLFSGFIPKKIQVFAMRQAIINVTLPLTLPPPPVAATAPLFDADIFFRQNLYQFPFSSSFHFALPRNQSRTSVRSTRCFHSGFTSLSQNPHTLYSSTNAVLPAFCRGTSANEPVEALTDWFIPFFPLTIATFSSIRFTTPSTTLSLFYHCLFFIIEE